MYSIGERVGSGCKGSVFKALRKFDSKQCVVKIMSYNEEEDKRLCLNEIKFCQKIQGQPHLVQMQDNCEDELKKKVYIFLEDAGDMSLAMFMKSNKEGLSAEVTKDLFD